MSRIIKNIAFIDPLKSAEDCPYSNYCPMISFMSFSNIENYIIH